MQNHGIKSIRLGYSCLEDYQAMGNAADGRHCVQCNKIVVDFASLTDQEVLDYFARHRGERVCGRFEGADLSRINSSLMEQKRFSLPILPIAVGAIMTSAACSTTRSMEPEICVKTEASVEIIRRNINPDSLQTTKIVGTLVNGYNDPLIGANIILDGTRNGTATDIEGKFELIFESQDSIITGITASYTGYEEMSIQLTDIRNNEIRVVLAEGLMLGDMVVEYYKPNFFSRMWKKVYYGWIRS